MPWRTRRDLAFTALAVAAILAGLVWLVSSVASMRRTEAVLRARLNATADHLEATDRRNEALHRASIEDRREIRARQAELMEAVRGMGHR